MINYITPNDKDAMGSSDSESIQNAIKIAAESGTRKVLIPRLNQRTGKSVWDIENAIILTSDIEIILDNCLLRQADGVFDNVFRSHGTTEEAQEASAQIHDVRIIGQGRAIIDGGIHNGITELGYVTKGGKHMSLNNMILLLNVRNFVIEGISFENQRFWALNFGFADRKVFDKSYITFIIIFKPINKLGTGENFLNQTKKYLQKNPQQNTSL